MSKIADITKYKTRIMDKAVQRYLSAFGAVCIDCLLYTSDAADEL